MTTREELKMYSDYKSPYAWLAFDPAFALEEKFAVKLKWKPFQLRIKGSGQRSVYSEYKVKYSYMDARRTANERSVSFVLLAHPKLRCRRLFRVARRADLAREFVGEEVVSG